MRVLKIVVLSMALLLVVGFGFLIWGLSRSGANVAQAKPAKVAALASVPVAEFGQVMVPLPPGGKVEQVQAVDNRLVVTVAAGNAIHLVVLDVASGQVAGTFVLDAPRP